MVILIFSLKIHITLVKKRIFWSHFICKGQKNSEKIVLFLMIRRSDNFQLIFSDQYKKTIILSIEIDAFTKKGKIRSSLSWKVAKATNLDRYLWSMFEHTLQLLHVLILKSKWLWKNQILLALYNSELSRHLHSEKSPMSMTKWKLSRILTMGSKFFWSSISINSNTLRNSELIFLSHFHGYSMCCNNSLG